MLVIVMSDETYDVVAVVSSFSTTFWLHRYLAVAAPNVRVLVLEAGTKTTHDQMLEVDNPRETNSRRHRQAESQIVNLTPQKSWNFFTGYGGASNCWYACTPRMLPTDFRLQSTYGVGDDWPLNYDELEPYYCEVERLMSVSGSDEPGPWPMSQKYPQPPHSYSDAARLFKEAFPDKFFPQATARARIDTDQRPACCASNTCGLCPLDAKFTILNGMSHVFSDPRVTLRLQARVTTFQFNETAVTRIHYQDGTADKPQDRTVTGDLFLLGANAIFNPFIMLRSGLSDQQLGKGICESVTCPVHVEFEEFQNFQGSTIVAGQGFSLYDGPHRKDRAAALMQVDNRVRVSLERGRWLSRMTLHFAFEDLRRQDNIVGVSTEDHARPVVSYHGRSDYCDRGIAALGEDVKGLLESLPTDIRGFEVGEPWKTDSHIQGTHVMGDDPQTSVVDADCIHHRLRNLIVLGGGVFPTAPAANPTLTISALALRSAARVTGSLVRS